MGNVNFLTLIVVKNLKKLKKILNKFENFGEGNVLQNASNFCQ